MTRQQQRENAKLMQRIEKSLRSVLPRYPDRSWEQAVTGLSQNRDIRMLRPALAEPVWDMLGRGGKRWRPLFGLMLLEALGVRSRAYDELIVALTEICHTGALIVDDLEDAAVQRRGTAAVHTRYGQATALNAANTLYFLPLVSIARQRRLSSARKYAIYVIISQAFVRAHLGQAADLSWSGRVDHCWKDTEIEARVLQMYADKTGAVVGGIAEIDAVIAGRPAKQARSIAAFGREFGIAFQIMDDVIDIDSRAKQRPAGEDIAEGKLTYVVLQAIADLSVSGRRRLLRILGQQRLRKNPAARQEAIRLIRESGAEKTTRALAVARFEHSWQNISRIIADSPVKRRLRKLCEQVLRMQGKGDRDKGMGVRIKD